MSEERKVAFHRVEDVFYEQGARRGWFTGLNKNSPGGDEPREYSAFIAGNGDSRSTEHGSKYRGWKPLALSTPILAAIIALTLLLAAAVETLAQRSKASGGLALSPTLDDIPRYAMISYLYVPTTLAVLYSLIWSWIDLDVKRMQPWFEMSKKEGATAKDSFFLDYQYTFVATVPWKAARRRHWPVFLVGTTMIIVLWLLTPLQSAILGTKVVSKEELGVIANRSSIRPMEEQTKALDIALLNSAYAVAWLEQPYPAFTTPEYAVLPFSIGDNPAPARVATNWTATTTKYWTELNCSAGEVEQRRTSQGAPIFDVSNGHGCTTDHAVGSSFPLGEYQMQYLGRGVSTLDGGFLSSNCSEKLSDMKHQILLFWGKVVDGPKNEVPDWNVTARWCQTNYYKQQVLATVDSATLQPLRDSVIPLADREILSEEEFNSTAFELLLFKGYPWDAYRGSGDGTGRKVITADYPDSDVLKQMSKWNGTGIGQVSTERTMLGFALAGQNYTMDEYGSPEILDKVYNRAHQFVFSLAVRKLLVDNTQFSNNTVSVQYHLTGIVVSRTFAIVVECILLLVAVSTGALLWCCRTADSNLTANPSSIGRLLDLARNSPLLLESFQLTDNADDKTLLKAFQGARFKLTYDGDQGCSQVHIINADEKLSITEDEQAGIQKGYYEPVKPLTLRRSTGATFTVALIGAVIALVYLKQKELALNGLTRPKTSFEMLQFLENYLPTILATLIEPFWVLLTRLLSGLQPFKELWKGKAKPATTIDSTYTAIPPQFVMWKALKSGHLILFAVCLMALLSNLLAVGLGSMFNEGLSNANYTETVLPIHAAKFDNGSVYNWKATISQKGAYLDHMYVALANLSSGTALPPWISQKYYFQEHDLSNISKEHNADTYTVTTRGYGVDLNCTGIPSPERGYAVSDIPKGFSNLTYCYSNLPFLLRTVSFKTQGRAPGPSAAEYAERFVVTPSAPDDCFRGFSMGWIRSPNGTDVNATFHANFAACRPSLQTAMFNVTLKQDGRVVSYDRASDLEESLGYPESEMHARLIFNELKWSSQVSSMLYHNDTLSRDWFNHFMMQLLDSRDFLDPKKPLVDLNILMPVLQDVYRRTFAILLGLNAKVLFEKPAANESTTILRHTSETRIFMEKASFIITMVILALNIIVAVIFYVRGVAFVLPRMPTTLGSLIAYVAPSRLASPSYGSVPGQAARTVSFGRYIGKDGEPHLGVEMDPHVVLVDPKSLKGGEGLLGRFRTPMGSTEDLDGSAGTVKRGAWI